MKKGAFFPVDQRLVGLVAKSSPDYFRRFVGHLRDGAVVVPLRGTQDRYRIETAGVTEIDVPEDGSGWIEPLGALGACDAIAQIAFTSGTEGEPKGVVLTHANLADTVARLTEIQQPDATIREYIGVPITLSFGFGRCRLISAVGGHAYLPPAGFDLHEIRALLNEGEINAISAVPTLWRLVIENRDLIAPLGDRLRWIEIGSQAMSVAEKQAMREIFPQARIIQHYGLTEASRATFLDVGCATPEQLASVGQATGDVEIGTTAEGRIRIRGSNVARSLLVGGQQVPNVDAEGWFVTKDLGRIENGWLHFEGRADDMINLGGIKLSADALEGRLRGALGIGAKLCVARIPDPRRGDGILVATTEDCLCTDDEIRAAASAALRSEGIEALSSVQLMRVASFPLTDSGKLRRFHLAEAFEAENAQPVPQPVETLAGRLRRRLAALRPATFAGGTIHDIYSAAFPGATIRDTDSFISLGGDSLSFVEITIALERHTGQLPADWQTMTIGELASILPRRPLLHAVDTTLFLRLVGIVAVVTYHFTEADIGGATYLLLLLAGYNFARFQLRSVLAADTVAPILLSTLRFVAPLFLVVAAIELRHGELQLQNLLLLGNFVPAAYPQFDYWFVEVLAQILLFFAVTLSVPALRQRLRKWPLAGPLAFLAAATVAALAGPHFWDTTVFYDRMPHMLLWLFVLGWAMAAEARGARLIVAALVLALPAIVWDLDDLPPWVANGPLWIWAGGLVLLAFRQVRVPFPLDRLAYWIGGASMFIYITHWSTQNIWHRIVPVSWPVLDIGVALVAGVLFRVVWDSGVKHARRAWRRHLLRTASPFHGSSHGAE